MDLSLITQDNNCSVVNMANNEKFIVIINHIKNNKEYILYIINRKDQQIIHIKEFTIQQPNNAAVIITTIMNITFYRNIYLHYELHFSDNTIETQIMDIQKEFKLCGSIKWKKSNIFSSMEIMVDSLNKIHFVIHGGILLSTDTNDINDINDTTNKIDEQKITVFQSM